MPPLSPSPSPSRWVSELLTVAPDLLTVRVLQQRSSSSPLMYSPASAPSSSSSASSLLVSDWSVQVPVSSRLSSVHRIVHLSSGYVDRYDATRNRAQVIVAVTASREVICIDAATRQILWSATAEGEEEGEEGREGARDRNRRASSARQGEEEEEAVAKDGGRADGEADGDAGDAALSASDVAVLINPHPMRVNDSGVVIVGVRMASGGHFSHFAFSGRSGVVRWSHDATSFLSSASHTVSSAHIVHEQHEVHTGEVEWRNFRRDFLAALPHSWSSPRDTALQLVQVTPPHRQGRLEVKAEEQAKQSSRQRASSSSISSSLPSSLLSVHPSSRLAHDSAEHLAHPNAVMVHTREGVELISFYTGRPLAHLALQPHQLHADLNGDGVVDHIQIVNGGGGQSRVGGEDPAMPFAAASWLSSFSPCAAEGDDDRAAIECEGYRPHERYRPFRSHVDWPSVDHPTPILE